METTQAKLFMKIATVMGQVRTVEKTGKNAFDKYDFMTADAIAHRIGSALAGNGIAFFPSIVGVETSEYTTAKGATNFRTVVNMQLTFACTETGATFTILWSGEAIDRSDKSISKAAVSAVKYALIKTFLLTGGDDDDSDSSSPEVETRKVAPRPAPVANGYKDDELWEPTASGKSSDAASPAQIKRAESLGLEFYGTEEWSKLKLKIAQGASKGAVSTIDKLKVVEIEAVIRGLEKRISERAAQLQATN